MPEGSGPMSPIEEARSLLWEQVRLARINGYRGAAISEALGRVEHEAIEAALAIDPDEFSISGIVHDSILAARCCCKDNPRREAAPYPDRVHYAALQVWDTLSEEPTWDCSGCGKQDVEPLGGQLTDSHDVPGEPPEYCGPLEVRHG